MWVLQPGCDASVMAGTSVLALVDLDCIRVPDI